ncbi:MAG TPA: metalloregulator ArsR/SmtB family transcription factor [Afifellaceae bacterium]|nr:metalloregulator ArsR/SmtB family transcription factor [Afifellaceae bacterium]
MRTQQQSEIGENMPALFSALADPNRLAIVERLIREGEKTAGELAEPFAISAPAISRHLNELERAGLSERRVERQWRRFRARPEAIDTIDDWLSRQRRFWQASFDRLEQVLAEDDDRPDEADR